LQDAPNRATATGWLRPGSITTLNDVFASENSSQLADPQPGGRRPAPGELALVQSFLNTRWDLRADVREMLVSGEALGAWLSARGLLSPHRDLSDDDVERALTVREGMRALASWNNGHRLDQSAIDQMHRASAGARAKIRIEPQGPRFLVDAGAGLDGAIGALYAIVSRAMIDGSWHRLKACPGRHCGWAFYDHSRNQSARWCSMNVCGDRAKSRAYYRRKTARNRA
jgi:predicted RNA-binding Zn ribbon-like protein